ncbi:hypothetical protein DS62_12900 [Smithella sp. SC_K08D17]|jgi:hypothetical protein|nr:hypothetical protein DS62_12900 [Smithella sp. SC_K08D17]
MCRSRINKKGDFPVIGGANIFKYGLNGHKGFLTKKDIHENRKVEFFKQPKIISQNIIAHIQKPFPHMMIIASLDNAGIVFNLDTVNNTIITDKIYDHKFILAMLNSKLTSWYSYKFIYCSAIRTMHFDEYYIGKIPIFRATKNDQQNISAIVDRILLLTHSDDYQQNPTKQAKVKEYEKEIDQMVYERYGLTEEEIKIVEGNIN